MASMDHDLGKLEHAYLGSNLKLETCGSIRISSPLMTTFPFSSVLQQLETIVSSDTWVARGTGLCIVLQLSITEVVSPNFDMPAFLEGLGILLCNAEIWSQLSLQASLKTPGENTSKKTLPLAEFLLTLKRTQTSSTAKTKLDHSVFVTTQDVSPPISIPSAHLDEIKLLFHFSFLSCGSPSLAAKKRRLDFRIGRQPDSDMLFGLHSPEESLDFIKHSQSIPKKTFQPQLLPCESSANNLFIGYDFDAPSQDRSLPKVCSHKPLFVGMAAAAISYPKRTSTSISQDVEGVSLTDLARLIDVGLRSMICKNVVHRSSDINAISISKRPKLSEIVPGLFSPGYMHALSQRNPLLPIIARAIPLIHRRARSLELQDKIKRLLNFSPEEYVAEDNLSPTGNQNTASALTAIVKARLWRLSQRKLFDHTAAGKLKPLPCTGGAFNQSLGSQSVLDEGYPSSQGTDILDQVIEVRDLQDEGYCSQATNMVVAKDDDDDERLLFAEHPFVLEKELDESNVLFCEEDLDVDVDLFWEEDCATNENLVEEDLFVGEEAIIMDDLSQEELDLLDDTNYDTIDTLSEIIEDEVLEDQLHIFKHDFPASSSWGECTHSQVDAIREEQMLLIA